MNPGDTITFYEEHRRKGNVIYGYGKQRSGKVADISKNGDIIFVELYGTVKKKIVEIRKEQIIGG